MRWLWMVVTAVTVIGTAASRVEAAPSFDCFKAAAPVEHLICNDPVLARYDEALAEAFSTRRKELSQVLSRALLDEQRQWLKGRLDRCGVPTRGDAPQAPASWPMVSCLVGEYEKRLTELGEPPHYEPSVVDEAISQRPEYVHPSCMLYASGMATYDSPPPPPVDVMTCNKAFDHLPLLYGGEEGSEIGAEGMSEGFYTWASLYDVGQMPDGRFITILSHQAGGSGFFSSVLAYRIRSDGTLVVQTSGIGGDRCNGGLEGGYVQDGGLVAVQSGTALDLWAVLGLPEEQEDKVDYCAICCFGSFYQTVTWPDGKGSQTDLLAFSPDPAALEDLSESEPQRCLQRALLDTFGASSGPIAAEDLKALKGPILTCLGGKKGQSK